MIHAPFPKWPVKFCAKTFAIGVMDHTCAPSPGLVFQHLWGVYGLHLALMHPWIFWFFFSFILVPWGSTHWCDGVIQALRHLAHTHLGGWVDVSLAWNLSPDYKWLKGLHHKVLTGCVIFVKCFIRRFSRRRTFLKIKRVWGSDLVHEIWDMSLCLAASAVKSIV